MRLSKTLTRFPRDKQIALNASQIMQQVLIALMPGILLSVIFFGIGVLIQLIIAMLTAILCEWSVAKLRQRRLSHLELSSGLVTAFLLALSLPATAPWMVVITGVAFGLLLGKHAYGGVGMNIFNPTVVGFCAVYLSFPAEVSGYPLGYVGILDSLHYIFSIPPATDGLVGATALSSLKAGNAVAMPASAIILNLAWLIGGIYLWVRHIADWRLSLTFVSLFILGTLTVSPFSGLNVGFFQHLGLGALIFTACFIVTDPTSAATGRFGRVVYACLVGILAVLIRQFSNMPDSMAFAVLLANMCVPVIDGYTRPQYNNTKGRGKS